MGSRTLNSIRNTIVAIVGQLASVVLSFIVRTIFIDCLGASYLGINGLFTNILSVLSFAELGFGTAIVYALYKPLAVSDEKKVAALMNFYAKIYRFIGLFILVAGACLIPNLSFFIGDTSEIPADLPPLWAIYILYLLNSSISYFFNYKRTLVTASQNGHIDSLNTLTFTVLRNILQVIILMIWHAFIPYLVIQIACTFLGNVFISIKADKLFPYLRVYKKENLSKSEVHTIVKNVAAMACHKLGSVIVSGTDNILISKFVGVVATGYYSNYTLLTSTIRTFYVQLFSPITASVGNFVAEKSREESFVFFKKLLFINAYIAVFCTSCLATLINPFIETLWGAEYVFSADIVAFIILNFYLTCMRQTACIYIDTNGLFWQVKWKSVFEALINLVASIVLAGSLNMGILGVIVGTSISTLATNFWWEPFVVFKYALKKNPMVYFGRYLGYSLTALASIIMTLLLEFELPSGIVAFFLRCIISAIIPNLLMILIYRRTAEWKYVKSIAMRILGKFIKKINFKNV